MDTILELDITREGTGYNVKARSTHGERSGFFELPPLNSKMSQILECIDKVKPLDEKFVKEFGTELFQLLFSGVKDLLHQCLDESDHVNIILNMKDPSLNVVPWELSYDPEYKIYLGADPQCSLVRRDQKSTQQFNTIDYPLKVLVIISSPLDLDERGEYQPDPDEIFKLMNPVKSLENKGMVQLDFLERASINRIQDKLKEGYDILHFVGHGFYDEKTGNGYLTIEDSSRNAKNLEGPQVAHLFGVNPPQLVILTACESSPLIPSLLSRKIPAVLAMQYTVLVSVAHQFVERFYSLLVKGDSVLQAVSDARSAVLLNEGIGCTGWFTPVLYVRSLDILKINTESVPVIPEKVPDQVNIDIDLIGVETFVGRRKDLWSMEKALLEDNLKMAIIKGIGGIGKTALASKFAKKHKDTFKAVFAKKMVNPEMGLEELLGVLDQFFIQNGDGSLHAVMAEKDLNTKLAALKTCLKKGYLIVLDNFEVLLEESHIKNTGVEQFLQAVLSGDHSSKVLITTRYGFTFQDEKRTGLVRPVDLDELTPQFALQLLGKLGISTFDVREKIYRKVGGNPQFLEFFVTLAESRSIKDLLRDITPVREKIGEWLLDELVELLTEEERTAFEEVSVFRLPVDRNVFSVLDVPGRVVDKLTYYSLVKLGRIQQDDGYYEYYFLHPGVRDYGYGLLSEDKKIEAHGKAAVYYEKLVEKKKAHLGDFFELHHHLFASEQYEKAGGVVIDLFEPFLRWGYWGVLRELLMVTVKTTEGLTKAAALHNLAVVLESFGNYKEAEKYYKKSLNLKESLGDKKGIATSLHQLGMLQYLQGNYREAEKYYKESLDLLESLGDKKGIAQSLHQLGMLQQDQGNYREAGKYYKESLDLKKSLGAKQGIAASLYQLGRVNEEEENYEKAVEYYAISLSIALELKVPQTEIMIKSLQRVKETIGEPQFETYWKAITNQEVPDFLTPTYEQQIEDLIQYILDIVDNNDQEKIEQVTVTLQELLKQSGPDEKQFFQLLLDYISRKDVSQEIKELKEPFKSLLEKYL